MKAAAIMNYWRPAAFLASLGSDGPGSGSGVAEPAVPDSRLLEYRTVLWMVLTLTWMPWIEFLSGRTCILLWILYGNMVDFSFIVSLYVSDFTNFVCSGIYL